MRFPWTSPAQESKPEHEHNPPRTVALPGRFDDDAVKVLLVCAGAYVAAGLIANVLSVRTVVVAGWPIDAGTLTYPLTFTLRDVIHKRGGAVLARWVIVSSAVFNLVLALGVWATVNLPGDPTNTSPAQAGFGPTLQSTWRIVVASIAAQVIAELLDTEAYRVWAHRFADRVQWGRVVASNAISVPIDSVLFVVIAFGGLWPAEVVRQVVWTNIVWKGLISLALIPLIYVVRERREVADEPDVNSEFLVGL